MLHGLMEEVENMHEVFSYYQLFFRLCNLNEITLYDPHAADLSLSILPHMKRMTFLSSLLFACPEPRSLGLLFDCSDLRLEVLDSGHKVLHSRVECGVLHLRTVHKGIDPCTQVGNRLVDLGLESQYFELPLSFLGEFSCLLLRHYGALLHRGHAFFHPLLQVFLDLLPVNAV